MDPNRAALSPQAVDHFREPRNVGSFPADEPGVGTGQAGGADSGDLVRIQVRIEEGVVAEARFKAFGCAAAIASASAATELVRGRSVGLALALDGAEIARAIALRPEKARYADLARGALRAALRDALERSGRATAGES